MAYREVEAGKGPTKANNIHREKEKYPKSKKTNRQLKTKIQNLQENGGTSDAQGVKSEGKTHKYSRKGRRVNDR